MEQSIDYKLKIDFLISNNIPISQPTQNKDEPKYKRNVYEKCNRCNKMRKPLDESHKICRICYRLYKPSGNKFVDDFIKSVQINSDLGVDMVEFVSHDQFNDIKFIAKVGYYKATWIDGNIQGWNKKEGNFKRSGPKQVFLKRLNNSENISSKELNEIYINIIKCILL